VPYCDLLVGDDVPAVTMGDGDTGEVGVAIADGVGP
jgi:hypothetical protein